LALLVRFSFFLIAHGVPFVESTGPYPALFQNENTAIAASVANGYGYKSPFLGVLSGDPKTGPSSWVAPVDGYFVAGVFWLFGVFSRQSFMVIVLVQCVLSALTVIPILRIGELTVGRRAAIIAAVAWAVFPWFSQWANTIIWDVPQTALLFNLLFWYALTLDPSRDGNSHNWRRWAGFGALWGFALLTNPALLTLMFASILWLGYRWWKATAQDTRHPSTILKPVLLTLVMCGVVLTPWLVRNRIVFGQFAFIRTNFPFEFWLGNYHGSHGRDWAGRHPTTVLAEREKYNQMGEMAYVHSKAIGATQFLREYPGEFVALTGKRFLMFWDGSTMKYNYPAAPYWLPWSYLPLSLLLVPCLIYACLRRIYAWELILAAFVLYPLPYYITFNQVRYRHSLEPLMLLLMAYAALAAFRRDGAEART
jgi:Dolichyl-phosphate-mannose-protein mannosyltransferase